MYSCVSYPLLVPLIIPPYLRPIKSPPHPLSLATLLLLLSPLLKHPYIINDPEAFLEVRSLCSYILRTRLHPRLGRASTALPRLARPIATERGVEDNVHVLEMSIDVAA